MKKVCFDGQDGDVYVDIWLAGGKLEITKRHGSNVVHVRGVGNSVADVLLIQPHVSNAFDITVGNYLPHYEESAAEARKQRIRKKRP